MKKESGKTNQEPNDNLKELEKLLLKDIKKNQPTAAGAGPGLIISRLPIRLLIEVLLIMFLYLIDFISSKELIVVLVTVPLIIEIIFYFLVKKEPSDR